jgi:hypothetical protein
MKNLNFFFTLGTPILFLGLFYHYFHSFFSNIVDFFILIFNNVVGAASTES